MRVNTLNDNYLGLTEDLTVKHRGRVVGIGIDAAEFTVVQRLIQLNELPHLKVLLAHGASGRIASPSHIGSGAVWPTFSTGTSPTTHGIYSFWDWNAQTMSVAPVEVKKLRPFWHDVAQAGYTVGVLDVPFTSPIGLPRGVEICEWGPHDAIRRRTDILPPEVREFVRTAGGIHPFSIPPLDAWGKIQDVEGRLALVRDCLRGIAQRGTLTSQLISQLGLDLCIVIFTEVHRASHLLWHTIDSNETPTHPPETMRADKHGLIEIYRAVDDQIGRIAGLLDPDDSLCVFALHGMQRTYGVPDLLDELLRRWGFASASTWRSESWSKRGRATLDVVRQRLPAPAKDFYHRFIPPAITIQVAGPPQSIDYNWARTSAFALPSDQHGWIRLNLAGREARGTLPRYLYEKTCTDIELLLRALMTDKGQPLVQTVLRPISETNSPPDRLPDLVIHWNDAAIGPATSVQPLSMPVSRRATHLTGQHSPDGFFVVRARTEKIENLGPSIDAQRFHLLLLRLLSTR